MNYYLAIDIGASSGRHILGSLQDGKLVLEEIYRFPNSPVELNGHLTWDITKLFVEILNGLKECRRLNKIPVSLAIDTWGVDYVLLDKDDKEILPAFCYRDKRTKLFLSTTVAFEEMYSRTGIQFQPFNTVYQLLADKAAGRLDKAESMLMIPEYFSRKLTGEKAREYTNATTTGLVNAKDRAWDYELIEKFGLPKKLFPPLSMPGHKLGKFSEEVQSAVGFDCDVTLTASHDTASAVVSVPDKDAVYISSGTWSLLGIVTEPILTDAARMANYTNEGAADGKIRFLKNIMGLWMIQQVRHELEAKYTFAELAEMAEKDAAYDWKIEVDRPRFLAPKSMITEIKDECKRSGQPVPSTVGQLAHCVYNSLAHSYKAAIDELERITKKHYETICIVGGGSNNNYLNLLTAKHTKRRVLAGPAEATAAGNLLVQIMSNDNNIGLEGVLGLISKSFEIKEINSDV